MAINNSIFSGSETQFGVVGTPTQIGQANWNSLQATTAVAEVWEIPSISVDWGISRHNQTKNDGSRSPQDGNVYYTLGRVDEAIAVFEKALKINPNNDTLRKWLSEHKVSK